MGAVQVMTMLPDPIHELISVTRRDRVWLRVALALAASAHVALGWVVSQRFAGRPQPSAASASELFDLEVPAPPELKPAPEAAVPQAQPPAAPAPKLKLRALPAAKEPPPPAALAQAGAIVTKQDEADEPVDLTSFVTGSAATYAGGATASTGTSSKVGRRAAAIVAAATDTGTGGGGTAMDRSAAPSVVGDLDWRCPFPAEADAARIDTAVATIRVAVDASGRLTHVDVLEDPAHGFGQAARRCAMDKSWRAARDRAGMPIGGSVTVRVRFVR